MRVMVLRSVVFAGLLAACGAGLVLADAHGEKGKGMPGKAGEHWDALVKAFDANGDGKISRQEFMAKRPLFDKVDANHDGALTQEEITANPTAQKHGKTGAGFVERFDGDKDGKVTAAEFDAKRAKAFDAMDKNHDGQLEQGEVKGQAPAAEGDLGT